MHHIREQGNGKCPACRADYSEAEFRQIREVDALARGDADGARAEGWLRDRAVSEDRKRAAMLAEVAAREAET